MVAIAIPIATIIGTGTRVPWYSSSVPWYSRVPLVLFHTYHGTKAPLYQYQSAAETLELFPANFEFVDPGVFFVDFLPKFFNANFKFPPSYIEAPGAPKKEERHSLR